MAWCWGTPPSGVRGHSSLLRTQCASWAVMLRQSWSWGSWGALLAVALAAPRLLGAGFLARLPAVAARAAEAAVLYALYYAEWVLLAGLIFWGAWRLFVRTQWRAYSLCRAASNNRADVVARLLREGVAPDAYRDVIYGGIPLHFAAARGHAAVVRILASAGGARLLRLPLNNGCTSLHLAAENGHLDVVGALLDAVTPEERQGFLKTRAESGGTCLHFAVRKGHTHVAGALTRAGATDLVGMQDSHGDSCLHLAARTGRANMLEVLLGAGSDHNLQNEGGLTGMQTHRETPVQLCLTCLLSRTRTNALPTPLISIPLRHCSTPLRCCTRARAGGTGSDAGWSRPGHRGRALLDCTCFGTQPWASRCHHRIRICRRWTPGCRRE